MNLQQAIKDAVECVNDEDISFRNDYSGRGMYGNCCVGISGSMTDCLYVISEVIKGLSATMVAKALAADEATQTGLNALADAEHAFENAVDTLFNFRQDSLGRGIIMYWHSLKPIAEEDA